MNLADFTYTTFDSHLLAIYRRGGAGDSFLVGKLLRSNSDSQLFALVGTDGSPDGFCLCAAAYIYRVELGSRYLQSLEKHAHPPVAAYAGADLWEEILADAEKRQLVMQAEDFAGKRILFGIPKSHTDTAVTMQRVRRDGSLGKTVRIQRSRIGLLAWDSETERALQETIKKRGESDAL